MPILDEHTLEFFSRSPEQTRRVGMRLGSLLQTGDMICLEGELGAGKTTLVQGMAQGWGSLDAVTSPTFVLVNVYRRPDATRFFHLDAYRLDSVAEAEELDIDDLLAQGPLVIEWPERIEPILPRECMWVHLEFVADEQRTMLFAPRGQWYEQMAGDLRQAIFGVT